MSVEPSQEKPDYLQARRPSRVYRGTNQEGARVVTVTDSALEDPRPRLLSPSVSRGINDLCEHFGWGSEGPAALQLALALLLDVSGDVPTAIEWHERFAATYVRRLPDVWTVPEVDIALWLYCFQNCRPES